MAGYLGTKAVFLSTTAGSVTGDMSVGGNVVLGDNSKAIFGAGSDLQIYHDGATNDSIITESGTGNLVLQGDSLRLTNTSGVRYLQGNSGAEVNLWHNGSKKLETTSTGIDVTGTVTADGLTVDGASAGRVTLGQFTNTTNAGGTEAAIALRNQATGNADVSLVASRIGANFGSDFYIETSDSVDGTNRKRLNIAEDGDISFYEDTGTTPKFFWDASAESLGIGTTTPSLGSNGTGLHIKGASGDYGVLKVDSSTTSEEGWVQFSNNGVDKFRIASDSSTNLKFIQSGVAERMRIDSSGRLLIGKTNDSLTVQGLRLDPDGSNFVRNNGTVMLINRHSSDGDLIGFYQAGAQEGTISVSGTTVSYNGGHLARWSQTADNTRIDSLVKGTVMTNLDQMAVWGDEDNEQLNCMAVSSVEGDPNVAGVFVNWDNDDETYTADMNIAMTGDMIIRIAQGTTVQRGDLLMSAGDGTAKPQGDDIVRSKTIAKVISTHITCTYDDGSYCVPCVLMAC